MLSRRLCCAAFFGLFLPDAKADGVPSPSEYANWKVENLIAYARGLLEKGKHYQKAIGALSAASQKEPENLDVCLLLACAYAARYASVSSAARVLSRHDARVQKYVEERAIWERAQKDANHPLLGAPAPEPPLEPKTPDDGLSFRLSGEKSRVLRLSLARKAQEQVQRAAQLSKNEMEASRKAEVEYIRGWCLFLLRRYPEGVIVDQSGSSGVAVPPDEIITCFESSTKLDDKSVYWQSLGIALVPDHLRFDQNQSLKNYSEGKSSHSAKKILMAADAFDNAIRKSTKVNDLLICSVLISPTMPDRAAYWLEKASRMDPSNAFLWYLSAEQVFRMSQKNQDDKLIQKGIGLIRSGNSASVYMGIPLSLPVPKPLQFPWRYEGIIGLNDDSRMILFNGAYISHYLTEKQNKKEISRSDLEILFDYGVKIISMCNINIMISGRDEDEFVRNMRRCFSAAVINCREAFDIAVSLRDQDAQLATFINDKTAFVEHIKTLEKEVLKK